MSEDLINLSLISGRQLSEITGVLYNKILKMQSTASMKHLNNKQRIDVLNAYEKLIVSLRKIAEES